MSAYSKNIRETLKILGLDGARISAAESEHVSDHNFVLHLWCPLGHDPLPDFRKMNEKLGRVSV